MFDSKIIHSPFKFLDPYAKNDKDIFFGRDEEIVKLYNFVIRNQLIVIYGPSGCGKTSLIQCGLANCFDITDWLPFYIRRGKNINNSLINVLKESNVLTGDFNSKDFTIDLFASALELMTKRYMRPIYLIFDQFEELLILGSKKEKDNFIKVIQKLTCPTYTQPCSLIFILREEYFGWLDILEKEIPGFANNRMRVEPMRYNQIIKVIAESCSEFNIKIENPENNIPNIIKSLYDKSGISLTYLQVYLDQIWRIDYDRTYPNGNNDIPYPPPLEFTTKEIKEFGDIKDVIYRFIIERTEIIQKDLELKFPHSPQVNSNIINNILDNFVTNQGTKLPIEYFKDENKLIIAHTAPKYLRELSNEILQVCLEELENNRIIRIDESSIELAHDKIAEFIYQQRRADRRRLDAIERQIMHRTDTFNFTNEYLTSKEIANYEYAIPQLNLDNKYLIFFERSKEYRRKKRIKKILGPIRVAITLLIIALFIIAFQSIRLANQVYSLYYLDSVADSISNKNDAIKIAKYVYDKNDFGFLNNWSPLNNVLKESFLNVLQEQDIHSNLAIYSNRVSSSRLNYSDFDVSYNGNYAVINDSIGNNKSYKLLDKAGNLVHTFNNVKYAYFTNRPNILLVAMSSLPKTQAHPLPYDDYPNRFFLYDCSKEMNIPIFDGVLKDTITLSDGFLHPIPEVAQHKDKEFDSHLIRFTATGNLIIPFYRKEESNLKVNRMLRIYSKKFPHKDLKSLYSTSLSKDGKYIMLGHGNPPIISTYTEDGKFKTSLKNIYFADFTEKGSIIFIRKGALKFMNSEGDSSKQFFINKDIHYAYADGNENHAIIISKDSLFLLNTVNGIKKSFKEKLVGFDFNKNTLFTMKVSQPGKTQESIINRRKLTGEIVTTFSEPLGIKEAKFNKNTNELLVLNEKYQLLLLNENLKKKAGFQLTPNDLFGFSKYGNKLFFVRDSTLNVIENNKHLVDFTNFNSTYTWLDSNMKQANKMTKPEKQKYKIKFPSEPFF